MSLNKVLVGPLISKSLYSHYQLLVQNFLYSLRQLIHFHVILRNLLLKMSQNTSGKIQAVKNNLLKANITVKPQ